MMRDSFAILCLPLVTRCLLPPCAIACFADTATPRAPLLFDAASVICAIYAALLAAMPLMICCYGSLLPPA